MEDAVIVTAARPAVAEGTSKSAPTRLYHWRQPTVNASEETDVLML